MLDMGQLDGLRELAEDSGDPDFLARFVDRYLEDAEAQLIQLQQAAARGDAPAVVEVAHALKGSSATMGAVAMASACAHVESTARLGELAGPESMDRVSVELDVPAWRCGPRFTPAMHDRMGDRSTG